MNKNNLTRQEMIEILIEDRMWDWVYARNYEGLKDMLTIGFNGFENYTDDELKEEIGWIEGKIGEIKEMLKRKESEKYENEPF